MLIRIRSSRLQLKSKSNQFPRFLSNRISNHTLINMKRNTDDNSSSKLQIITGTNIHQHHTEHMPRNVRFKTSEMVRGFSTIFLFPLFGRTNAWVRARGTVKQFPPGATRNSIPMGSTALSLLGVLPLFLRAASHSRKHGLRARGFSII